MKYPILILHGWGKKGSDYIELENDLKSKGFVVYSPDLPGFGKAALIHSVMVLDDYVRYVLDLIKEKKYKKVVLVGHSFGGRISAKLSALHPEFVEKLILTGSPLIKKPLSLKKQILSRSSRVVKRIFGSSDMLRKILYKMIGEWDYFKANPHLKETFKKIISEDLNSYLEKIKAPTLVLWGQFDTVVSAKIGREISKKIPNAKYLEISGSTHKLPYEKPVEFAKKIVDFIQG